MTDRLHDAASPACLLTLWLDVGTRRSTFAEKHHHRPFCLTTQAPSLGGSETPFQNTYNRLAQNEADTVFHDARYNGDEEDMLTALHFPIYDEELTQLVAESDGGSANEMHHAQIDILQQYFKDHKASNVRFHEKKWSKAAVGGAGRASAEVTRDLSNFYPSITAIAVDHRQDIADVFEKDGSAKKAFANFIKELGKKWHHLPSFANDAVAAHYLALYDELNKRGKDAWTAENIGRILRANAKMLGDKALPSDGSESKLTAASNFVIDFGARGSGDVLFAAPKCYNGENPYVPGTMDEKLLEQATALLAGKV